MNFIDFIGYSSGLIIAIALAPQAIRAWRTKSTKDISLVWNLTAMAGLALYMVYGFMLQENPIIVTSAIELALAMAVMVAKLKYG